MMWVTPTCAYASGITDSDYIVSTNLKGLISYFKNCVYFAKNNLLCEWLLDIVYERMTDWNSQERVADIYLN